MKRIAVLTLSLLMILLAVNNLQAQIRKIPAEVTDAFKAKYPKATNVEWKDKLTVFQAGFQMDGVSYLAKFNSKGEWQQTEKASGEDALPTAVKDGFSKSKYSSDWDISDVAYIQYKDGSIEYRILVKRGSLEKKYLYFSEDGKLKRDTITL